MGNFEFVRLKIPDVILIKPKAFSDSRGYFMETYKESDFLAYGINAKFKQDNQSKSSKYVLRGLHYQLEPYAQGKLVRVITGSIFDVAVDLRKGSPYFGKWVGVKLSEENKRALWIPEGFAHGFLSLEDNTIVVYKVTNEYNKESEAGILWNDPDIGIKWPYDKPILSDKDSKNPTLKEAKINFKFIK
ncbi:MAG: dTDP-4-dehydrorhamnose 3,5-epimerase [Fervidicoccaceae archaeon]